MEELWALPLGSSILANRCRSYRVTEILRNLVDVAIVYDILHFIEMDGKGGEYGSDSGRGTMYSSNDSGMGSMSSRSGRSTSTADSGVGSSGRSGSSHTQWLSNGTSTSARSNDVESTSSGFYSDSGSTVTLTGDARSTSSYMTSSTLTSDTGDNYNGKLEMN